MNLEVANPVVVGQDLEAMTHHQGGGDRGQTVETESEEFLQVFERVEE